MFKDWEKNVLKGLKAQKKNIDQNEQAKNLYGGFYICDSGLKFIEPLLFGLPFPGLIPINIISGFIINLLSQI